MYYLETSHCNVMTKTSKSAQHQISQYQQAVVTVLQIVVMMLESSSSHTLNDKIKHYIEMNHSFVFRKSRQNKKITEFIRKFNFF